MASRSWADRLQGIATLTFRALHGTAPPYMTSQFARVADLSNRRRLRSASSNQLDVPSFRLPTVGSRAFPIADAKVWSSLPDDVTSALSLSTFRRHLKTYLFRRCYNTDWYCSYLLWLYWSSWWRCCLGHFKNTCVDDNDNLSIAGPMHHRWVFVGLIGCDWSVHWPIGDYLPIADRPLRPIVTINLTLILLTLRTLILPLNFNFSHFCTIKSSLL